MAIRRRGGKRPNTLTEFMALIEVTPDCWRWHGRMLPNGYGQFSYWGSEWYSHRLIYVLFRGPIPDGLDLDHLCRNRACVNPDHLEAVSRRINLLRGSTIPAKNAAKTHCKNGHEFTPGNTNVNRFGVRRCRACWRRWANAAYLRKHA